MSQATTAALVLFGYFLFLLYVKPGGEKSRGIFGD